MDTAIAVKSMNKELPDQKMQQSNLNADTDNKGAQRNLINAQAHQAHIDAQNKNSPIKSFSKNSSVND